MPTDKILKFKRGNTTKNNAYTGSDGELTVDRTKKTLVVHDGINAGGSPLATEESVNNVIQELENKVDINENITTQGNLFNGLDQLVKLDSSGKLPAIDGSQLTGVSSGSLVNSGVSAGTYKSVTVNSKGIIIAGTNPTTLNEYGITDAATSSSLNIEKGRIDAILSASSADKDSFKEIVDLINSVDSTNDTAFAGYVLSNDSRSATIEGDISALESNKADKATTLSGYGITDADTSAQVTTKVNNAVSTAVSGLVNSAPGLLDTLDELANALGDDPNFATTVANNIATKVTKNADIVAGTGTKVTYDAKGLVTGSTTPTTLAGYSIGDAYTKTEVNNSLALKVDDSEIASVNLLRADKYLAAQAVANMVYNGSGKLSKVQYNNSTDVDYEVLTYNVDSKLSNVAHYTTSTLRGNTVLSYSAGKLVSAIYTGV